MPKKDSVAPFKALERITHSESVPSLEDFLKLGSELHAARLDFFVRGAFPESPLPAFYAGILVKNSCQYHRMADENARAGIQGVADVLAQLAEKPKFWPYVRDELVKFAGLVAEEVKSRNPDERPTKTKRRKPNAERDKWIKAEPGSAPTIKRKLDGMIETTHSHWKTVSTKRISAIKAK